MEHPEAETFTLTREPHPEYGVLWAGYQYAYSSGQVGLLVTDIHPGGPASRAGMTRKHERWLIVGVNGENVWSLEDRFSTTMEKLESTKVDGKFLEPYDITIRPTTFEDEEVAENEYREKEARLKEERCSEKGLRELISKLASKDSTRDVLRSQVGVEMILKMLPDDFKRDINKVNMLQDILKEHGWRGKMTVSMSIPVSPGMMGEMGSLVSLVESIPGMSISIVREVRDDDQKSAEDRRACAQALEEAKKQDEDVEELKGKGKEKGNSKGKSNHCVVCFSRKRKIVIMHDGTGHLCICNQCFQVYAFLDKKCPICNQSSDGHRQGAQVTEDEWGVTIFDP